MLLPQEFIRHKRDGGVLEPEHIDEFIQGLTTGPGLRGPSGVLRDGRASAASPWRNASRSPGR